MEAARALAPARPIEEAVAQARTGMRDSPNDAWHDLLGPSPDRVAIAVAITVGILDSGFRQIDAGRPAELVVQVGVETARALVAAFAKPSSLLRLILVVWRRPGACIARPTREGYRVVSRRRRTPRGACLGVAKPKY